MRVLVTGGAGYIGSHACLRLLLDGAERVISLDNLSRGHRAASRILEGIGEGRFAARELDLADTAAIAGLLESERIDLVLHFAALAAVGESVEKPLLYWRNNVGGTVSLLEAMETAGVASLVFSSTCATYGEPTPERIPISEACPQAPVNPYGASKLACERVILEHAESRRRRGDRFGFAILRYFNVVGCDRGGRLGEDHRPETLLVPICLSVAVARRESLSIFGEDYPTPDGTGIRDYIHVEDLVDAHVRVSEAVRRGEGLIYNLGTGRGHSVLEVIESARRITGHAIPARKAPRRAGDPAMLVNDPRKIERELGWKASIVDLDEIVRSAWEWRRRHPDGYRGG
jgi:UDP-glucose 4-epimerase